MKKIIEVFEKYGIFVDKEKDFLTTEMLKTIYKDYEIGVKLNTESIKKILVNTLIYANDGTGLVIKNLNVFKKWMEKEKIDTADIPEWMYSMFVIRQYGHSDSEKSKLKFTSKEELHLIKEIVKNNPIEIKERYPEFSLKYLFDKERSIWELSDIIFEEVREILIIFQKIKFIEEFRDELVTELWNEYEAAKQ